MMLNKPSEATTTEDQLATEPYFLVLPAVYRNTFKQLSPEGKILWIQLAESFETSKMHAEISVQAIEVTRAYTRARERYINATANSLNNDNGRDAEFVNRLLAYAESKENTAEEMQSRHEQIFAFDGDVLGGRLGHVLERYENIKISLDNGIKTQKELDELVALGTFSRNLIAFLNYGEGQVNIEFSPLLPIARQLENELSFLHNATVELFNYQDDKENLQEYKRAQKRFEFGYSEVLDIAQKQAYGKQGELQKQQLLKEFNDQQEEIRKAVAKKMQGETFQFDLLQALQKYDDARNSDNDDEKKRARTSINKLVGDAIDDALLDEVQTKVYRPAQKKHDHIDDVLDKKMASLAKLDESKLNDLPITYLNADDNKSCCMPITFTTEERFNLDLRKKKLDQIANQLKAQGIEEDVSIVIPTKEMGRGATALTISRFGIAGYLTYGFVTEVTQKPQYLAHEMVAALDDVHIRATLEFPGGVDLKEAEKKRDQRRDKSKKRLFDELDKAHEKDPNVVEPGKLDVQEKMRRIR